MLNIISCYLIVAVLEISIVPVENYLHNKFENKEIARKWGHILAGTILWIVPTISNINRIHSFILASLFTIASFIIHRLGMINNKRNDNEDRNSESNNGKAALLLSLGYTIPILLSYINPNWWLICGLTIFNLCFGDGFAALIGVKYGKHSIKLSHNKSLIGSISFVIFSILGMFIPCFMLGINVALWKLLILAIVGAITEIYSGEYDNLLIPLITFTVSIVLL